MEEGSCKQGEPVFAEAARGACHRVEGRSSLAADHCLWKKVTHHYHCGMLLWWWYTAEWMCSSFVSVIGFQMR